MLLEKYDPQSSGSIFSGQASTTDQQSARPSITRLPRIPNTPTTINSSQNSDLLPSQNRPTVSIPNIDRVSAIFGENPVGRGPKIYTKNLPDVFTSGTTVNRNKKFHGIRERNQADDVEQNSMHVGTPTINSKKSQLQPFVSPARFAQIPSLKAGRKTNDPFDVPPASMKENIEGYSVKFNKVSPRKDLKLLKNERYGLSPSRRGNKIRIRTNIEYGSIFDNNGNIGPKKEANKEEDEKKPNKKVVVLKKSSTSDSKFFDENNREVKVKMLEPTASKFMMLGNVIQQLNELITIKKVKNTIRNGVVKRMLHVPTFRMFDVLEESTADITSKENNEIRGWITNWKNNFFQRSQNVSKIYGCFWNSPEGCVSVVCESARNGYLSDIIDFHGSLPEKAVQNLAKQILGGISEIHSQIYKPHGNINPREILIDNQGVLKITPAVSCLFPNPQKQESKSPRSIEGIIFRPSVKAHGLSEMRPWSSLPSIVDLSQDIFDFGYTLLQCALGDFSAFDMNSPISLENIKPILTNPSLQKKSDACCLIHSEDIIRKLLANNSASVSSGRRRLVNNNYGRKRNKLLEDLENSFHSDTPAPYMSLYDALVSMNRFSEGFVDFLCSCLRFDRDQRPRAEELLEHKFLSDMHQAKGPLVSFQELVGLGSKSPGSVLKSIENENETGLNKLGEALRVVLLNRHVKERFDLLMKRRGKTQMDDKAIVELAGELGVSSHKLRKKLNECLADLQD